MWTQLTAWTERKITYVSSVLIFLVFALWALSQFVPELSSWLTKGSFYNVVTLVLLFEIARRVVEIKNAPQDSGVDAFPDQDSTWTALQPEIAEMRPQKVDMIEYSGNTAVTILTEVFKVQPAAAVRLLLHHPKSNVLNKFERDRINQNLEAMRRHFSQFNLTVRLYTPPASVRGRNYDGQIVSIGWYTYHWGEGETEIRGHTNAMVVGRTSTPAGRALQETFDRTFANLWDHQESEAWTPAVPAGR